MPLIEMETQTGAGVHLLRATWSPRLSKWERGHTRLEVLGVPFDFRTGRILTILDVLERQNLVLRRRVRLEQVSFDIQQAVTLDDQVLQERAAIHDLLRFPSLVDRDGNLEAEALAMLEGQIFGGRHGAEVCVIPGIFENHDSPLVREGYKQAIARGNVHLVRFWQDEATCATSLPDALLRVRALFGFGVFGRRERFDSEGRPTPIGAFITAIGDWRDRWARSDQRVRQL